MIDDVPMLSDELLIRLQFYIDRRIECVIAQMTPNTPQPYLKQIAAKEAWLDVLKANYRAKE